MTSLNLNYNLKTQKKTTQVINAKYEENIKKLRIFIKKLL